MGYASSDLDQQLKKYKITHKEYEIILQLLGREPKDLEWPIFSALWSEHCSYKSSRFYLKKLFNKSDRVLEAFGENAGVIDLGEGEKVAFKMESHNHPSFIEPYQGAATGVGGIVRDILTMGARPVALANFLCFGEPSRMHKHVDGVVRGIGDYGNCVGIPMITGRTEFDSTFNDNVLVNALCVGLFGKNDPIVSSKARGTGNYVVYVGAKTGRDGVHGARMASESFNAADADKRPNIQIGDPFYEKLLIESFLEASKKQLFVAGQDMGAAGLISSSFEMASKGQVGMTLDLDLVPLRDENMTPEEILVSESQERMLVVCEPKKFSELQNLFDRWDLDAVMIGEVIEERKIKILVKGKVVVSIDPDILVENAPQFERPYESSLKTKKVIPKIQNLTESLSTLEASSKEWIYRQYDQRVGTQTVYDCHEEIGVLRLPSERFLGVALGGRARWMAEDPNKGGFNALFEPALQLILKGIEPLAATDCLNFGNPERPEIMGQFVEALEGMNSVAQTLSIPIISGNVSFYNETNRQNIIPMPTVGVVGLGHLKKLPSSFFSQEGETLWLLETKSSPLDFLKQIDQWIREHQPSYTRLVTKQGLSLAISRSVTKNIGAQITTTVNPWEESLYQVLVSLPPTITLKTTENIQCTSIGKLQSGPLTFEQETLDYSQIKKLRQQAWRQHFYGLS